MKVYSSFEELVKANPTVDPRQIVQVELVRIACGFGHDLFAFYQELNELSEAVDCLELVFGVGTDSKTKRLMQADASFVLEVFALFRKVATLQERLIEDSEMLIYSMRNSAMSVRLGLQDWSYALLEQGNGNTVYGFTSDERIFWVVGLDGEGEPWSKRAVKTLADSVSGNGMPERAFRKAYGIHAWDNDVAATEAQTDAFSISFWIWMADRIDRIRVTRNYLRAFAHHLQAASVEAALHTTTSARGE